MDLSLIIIVIMIADKVARTCTLLTSVMKAQQLVEGGRAGQWAAACYQQRKTASQSP